MEALLNRRLDCNFNGYRVPVVPRASRSARGRGRIRKKCGDSQIRAFEILARVAGKFLQEGESCNATFAEDQCDVKTWGQRQDDGQFPKMDISDRESCYKETLSMPQLRGQRNYYSLKKSLDEQENYIAEGPLVSEHFDHSQAMSVAEELDAVNSKNVHRCLGEAFPRTWKHFEGQLESGTDTDFEAGSLNIGSTNSESVPLHGSLEDSMDLDINQHSGVSVSGSNTKASVLRDCIAIGSFPGCSSDTNVVSKGSDKNSVGDSLHGTLTKPCRPLSYIGDQRMGATPASKHWKLKGRGFFKSDGKSKPIYCSGRMRYNDSERSEMIFPFKKRKFFNQNELSTSTRAFHCEDVFDSSGERTNSYSCGSATGASSSAADQQASPESRDCNVKLSIKSFKVPELFIEIPTTATIGSLKRTVMEAVTARLRDGLHVGILLQGKKVSDDSKTLMQTGISQDNMHHSLGFMLEPRHAQNLPPHCTEDLPFSSISKLGEPIRHKTSSALQPKTSSAAPVPPEISFGSCSGADFGKVLSIAEPSTNNTVSDSRALVAVPAITMEALAVVPFHRKTGHPEFGKRRMRRPFSVPEVEALVQAVEKLGTGRWRDVKMRAFDNASHRTYVDLKDKWKTLVHTARISPQQRRGEPVPQELLDRVLAAHAYWSHHHERQPLKAAI